MTPGNASLKALVLFRRNQGYREYAQGCHTFFDHVIQLVLENLGITWEQIDPADYGLNDTLLFQKIRSTDLMIVNAIDDSLDYYYSLGVRHALTNKPTIIITYRDYMPSDIAMTHGVYRISNDTTDDPILEFEKFKLYVERIIVDNSSMFSPVIAALETAPRVFLSYAHADRESVQAVDQWLRDKGARVDIDERNFIAGRDIRDEILQWLRSAGKIICFYSKNSSTRYYPKLERRIVEEFEASNTNAGVQKTLLLYLRVDDTPLPAESSYRLAINAYQMSFDEACNELWRNLLEKAAEPKRINLAKYRRRAPWEKPR